MAQEQNGIAKANKAIADGKKLLEGAIKFNGPVKKATPSPVPAAPKPKAPSAGMLGDQGADSAAGIKAKADNVDAYVKSVPKMHKGGVVEEDGVKNLKKGEVVIPKEKAEEGKKIMAIKDKAKGPMSKAMEEEENEPESEAKKETKKDEKKESKKESKKEGKAKPHKFGRTEIIHHKNGSHTVTHHPHPSKPSADGSPSEPAEPVSYAAPDMASMQQGMEQNLGGGPEGQPSAAAPAAEEAPAQA